MTAVLSSQFRDPLDTLTELKNLHYYVNWRYQCLLELKFCNLLTNKILPLVLIKISPISNKLLCLLCTIRICYNVYEHLILLQEVSQSKNLKKLTTFKEICTNFKPVFHQFFFEKFTNPGTWFERKLAYTHRCVYNFYIL